MSSSTPYNHPDFRLDFIGIGAAKSGTTWLADQLRSHQNVFIPEKKELVYFNDYLRLLPGTQNPDRSKSLEWYHAFFKESAAGQLNGEISVEYLLDKGAPKNIYNYNPNAKILVILRKHPDQLFSLYQYMSSRGVFHFKDFETAIEKRSDLFMNYYFADFIERYLQIFPKKQVGIYFFDDIIQQPEQLFSELCEFLEIPNQTPESLHQKSNKTKEARVPIVNHVIQKTRHFITANGLEFIIPVLKKTGIISLGSYIRDSLNVQEQTVKPKLSESTREKLKQHYQQDVLKLEQLSGRRLDSWK